jgi:hypothetical protein
VFNACTICQPSLIFVKVDGEKQSPENNNKASGYSFFIYYTLALKLQIPADPPLD